MAREQDDAPQGTEQTADLMDFMDAEDGSGLDAEGTDAGTGEGSDGDPPDDNPDAAGDAANPDDDSADDEGLDDGEAEETAAANQAGDAPGTSEPPSWEPTTPFTYRSGQVDYALGDACVGADGVLFVPPEQVERVRALLTQGQFHEAEYPRERQQWQRQLQDANTRFDRRIVEAEALSRFYANLMGQGPDAVVAFLSDFERNRPKIEAFQREQVAKAYYEQGQRLRQPDQADVARQEDGQRRSTIDAIVQTLATSEAHRGLLTAADLEQFRKRLERQSGLVFKRAEQDMPASGLKKGQLYYDQDYVNAEIAEYAGMLQAARSQQAATQRAAAQNAQRNGGARSAPARGQQPGRPGHGPQAGVTKDRRTGRFQPGQEGFKPTTRAEWLEHTQRLAGVTSAHASN